MAQSKEPGTKVDETAAQQPQAGTVISPGQSVDLHSAESSPTAPSPAPIRPASPMPAPSITVSEPDTSPEIAAKVSPQEQPEATMSDNAETAEVDEIDQPESTEGSISWTASEFVAHEKTAGWYVLLLVGALVFAAGAYLLTKDVVSTGVVIVAAIILAVYGSHKPAEQQYVIDDTGIGIGQKHYNYDEFKSFAMASEGAFSSLVFMPLKRFAVPLTIYFAPKDEERIVNLLSNQLPLEEHRLDAVDHLIKKMRF